MTAGSHQRLATNNTLDRCDLLAGSSTTGFFALGTLAVRLNRDNQAMAVQSFLTELESNSTQAAFLFTGVRSPTDPGLGPYLINNDIVIPAATTTHDDAVYVATLNRALVIPQVGAASTKTVSPLKLTLPSSHSWMMTVSRKNGERDFVKRVCLR